MVDKQIDFSNDILDLLTIIKLLSNGEINKTDIDYSIKLSLSQVAYNYLTVHNSSIIIQEQLQRIVSTSRLVLNTIINEADGVLKTVEKTKADLTKFKKFREKYPLCVSFDASKDALKFFDSLKFDEYSFTDAAPLILLTRQTLSTYLKNGLHGFSRTNKVNKISKMDIYNYYIKYILKVK